MVGHQKVADFMDQESNLPSGEGGELSAHVGQKLLRFKDVLIDVMSHVRYKVLQGFFVLSIICLLLWVSTFLYGSFYYSYMPVSAFSTSVHYYYRTDCESPASFSCSYPVANISLVKNKKHVLTFGQPYRMSLQLVLPDSPANRELGMFMIKATCFSRDEGQVFSTARSARHQLSASSSRFTMMQYHSDLVKNMRMLLFLPAFLTGIAEQKQVLEVELFSDYTDDPYVPSVTAVIEILSSNVQIYSSQLHIHAHFTGIRYLLFYFPLLSALVGVASNFIFLSLLFILSYVRLLLRADWGSGQFRPDGPLPDRNRNNHREDENDFTTGMAELPSR